jgi:hypothetical protein
MLDLFWQAGRCSPTIDNDLISCPALVIVTEILIIPDGYPSCSSRVLMSAAAVGRMTMGLACNRGSDPPRTIVPAGVPDRLT